LKTYAGGGASQKKAQPPASLNNGAKAASGREAIDTKRTALRIAAIAKGMKAQKITVLDMRAVSGFCDYFVIASATSLRQLNALSRAIEEEMLKERQKPLSKALPNDESGWVALDYSGVVAHIFYKPLRDFYSLERLWSDAKKVRITRKAAP